MPQGPNRTVHVPGVGSSDPLTPVDASQGLRAGRNTDCYQAPHRELP
jgi:hypothetical protein